MQYRVVLLVALLGSIDAHAQLRLPGIGTPGVTLPGLPGRPVAGVLTEELRRLRLRDLIRHNRGTIAEDPHGDAIVRNEILALPSGDEVLPQLLALGFSVVREQDVLGDELRLKVLAVPTSMSMSKALRTLRGRDPGGVYDYNHLYSGSSVDAATAPTPSPTPTTTVMPTTRPDDATRSDPRIDLRVGLLDTGIDTSHPVFANAHFQRWGCAGAQVPAAHGTAVASLMIGHSDGFNGVIPRATLYAADVYCGQPTGGAVDAIAAALGWMLKERVAVINVSLVGPRNLMLERIVSLVVARGHLLVAAVGNDGPAAAPLYPAAYPHVVGVTAVDARRHVLLEACRGPQVMFAAPGADMVAATPLGVAAPGVTNPSTPSQAFTRVRGTSFASPIVAGLLAELLEIPDPTQTDTALKRLRATAIDLGEAGKDLTYGDGLVGESFRNGPERSIRN